MPDTEMGTTKCSICSDQFSVLSGRASIHSSQCHGSAARIETLIFNEKTVHIPFKLHPCESRRRESSKSAKQYCNRIAIGDEVQIAHGAHIYTATHPVAGLEYALPVLIQDGVWLGGRAIVCPGVAIGANTVVGTGSVVTRDLPSNVLAVGSLGRIILTFVNPGPEQ